MKWRIASVEAESSRFRNDSASTGLYRFRVDPVGGGLTRSRDGPASIGLYRFRVDPVGGGLTRSQDGPAARAGCPASGLIAGGRIDPKAL